MTTETQAPDPAQALLVQALEDIIEPFAYIERNLPEGYRLDGCAALQQINSREFYTRIAKEALAAHRSQAIPAPEGAQAEPVAWRWRPSAVFGEYVLSGDKDRAELAREHGMAVEPLYRAALAAPKAPEGAQLPPLPPHPDARVFTWTSRELAAIKRYGEECARAALAAHPGYPAGQKAAGPGPGIVRCPRCWELVTAPQTPVALTDEQIVMDGLMHCPNRHLRDCATAFEAGVRFAERAHSIPAPKEPKA